MGFLDFLSSGLTTATQAAGAEQQGEAQGRAEQQKSLLERIALMRQMSADEDQKRLQAAQIGHLNAQTTKLGEVAPETFGDFENLTMGGTPSVVQRGNRGTVRPVDGASPYVAPQQPPQVNPETARHNRAMEDLAAKRGTSAGRPPTAASLKAQSLLMMAEQANTLLRQMGSAKSVPSWIDQQKAKIGMGLGNVMSPEAYQKMRQAAHQLSDAWLRYTSGAAVPETEVARFAETFTPVAGDSPGLTAQKAAARERLVQAMRKGAGPSSPDVVPPDDIKLPYEP